MTQHVKTELFFKNYIADLQSALNEFLINVKPENLIEIKYISHKEGYSAMVIYKK